MYMICPRENRIYYSLGNQFPTHCRFCGTRLEEMKEINNLHDLVAKGFKPETLFILSKAAGKVPPSCSTMENQGKTYCPHLKQSHDEESFNFECLQCQYHLLEELTKR